MSSINQESPEAPTVAPAEASTAGTPEPVQAQDQMTDQAESAPVKAKGPLQHISDQLAGYLQAAWPSEWPILWQNMPAPVNHHNAPAWAQFRIRLGSIKPLDLGGSRRMVRGQIVITATAPKDTGMTVIDAMADTVLVLFGHTLIPAQLGPTQQMGHDIRMGSITINRPRYDRGYMLMEIEINFTTLIDPAPIP